jgi:hypothetical protein
VAHGVPRADNGRMEPERPGREITSRLLRASEVTPADDWAGTTAEERIEAVWELTLQCLAWNQDLTSEPRLQRSVVRLRRRRR